MVEISLQDNNDTNASPSDDNKCNKLQLSCVSLHRGPLSSTDPLTNYDKKNECTNDNVTCNRFKRKEQLESMNVEIDNKLGPVSDSEVEPPTKPSECTPTAEKSRGAKRRRRTPWRSDQIRRQRNAKGRLSRAEMPYDELLKLREKERIAQQQRRERLRKCEAKNIQVHRDRLKEFCLIKSTEPNKNIAETIEEPVPDEDPRLTEEEVNETDQTERTESANENGSKKEMEALSTEIKSCVEPKADSVVTCASSLIGDAKKCDTPDKLSSKKTADSKKISFMLSLGLAYTTSSVMNVSTSSNDEKMLLGQASGKDTAEFAKEDPNMFEREERNSRGRNVSVSSSEGCKLESHASDETSVSSMDYDDYDDDKISDCHSDAGGNKSSIDSLSLYRLKKARRSNLSKEELEKLREKERMAKRRQRARNKEHSSSYASSGCLSEASDEALKSQDAQAAITEIPSTGEPINKKPSDMDEETETGEIKRDTGNETNESRKKMLSRLYDRSLLSPGELESLRRREREYQRKRRARLRDEKLKSSEQVIPSIKNSQRIGSPENDIKFVEQTSKRHETRSSNGIIRPSHKYLECSQDLDHESKEMKPVDVAPWKDEPYDDELEFFSNNAQIDGRCSAGLETKTSCRNNMAYDSGQKNEHSTKEFDRRGPISFDSSLLHAEQGRESPFIEALFATDYKRKDSNGFYRASAEPRYEYRTRGSSQIEPSWRDSHSKAINAVANTIFFNDKYCYGNVLENHLSVDEMTGHNEAGKRRPSREKSFEQPESQKWRHWKSGLSDDQLQRRRLSNREAQRRRRMRLKMMQMSSQHVDLQPENATHKERTGMDDSSDKFTYKKAFSLPKTRLENILEKRRRVFLDAQMEKSRIKNEEPATAEIPPPHGMKSRGCRVKVTPQRHVVVPSMSYANEIERELKEDFVPSDESEMSPAQYFSELSSLKNQASCNDVVQSSTQDEIGFSTSSRKRKQFCPRRLLTDAEKRNNDSMQRLAIAQF